LDDFRTSESPEIKSLVCSPAQSEQDAGLDAEGQERHWIFEIHVVNRARQIGGFYEERLTLG
jgi:hypothetical protein